MAKNAISDGNTIQHTAAADIASGDLVDLSGCVGIAHADIASGAVGTLHLAGEWNVVKATGVGWSEGETLYVGSGTGVTDAPGTTQAGVAGAPAVSGDTTCALIINI